MKKISLAALLFPALGLTTLADAQIPDLLNSLEPGSPSLGAGGAFDPTAANTFSTFYNPAGLAYITRRQLSVAYRNLPSSRTIVGGDFNNPAFATQRNRGKDAFTHFGYAQPLKGGSLGLSYTTGGFIDDERTGNSLAVGNFVLNNYSEKIRAKTDFFTVGYGRTNRVGNVAFGAGLVLASVGIENRASGTLLDAQNQPQPFNATDNESTGTGIGAILGLQFSPSNAPQTSWALSVRTPISLSGNEETAGLYDRVPGVVRLGFAARTDFGNGNSLTYGAHLASHFGGDGEQILDRSNQTTFGIGAEYALRRGDTTFPLRIGYMAVPSGGDGFERRDAFTLGVGYRPRDERFSLDVAYVLPSDSGRRNDLAFTATYRF